jgi:hypothetical protein
MRMPPRTAKGQPHRLALIKWDCKGWRLSASPGNIENNDRQPAQPWRQRVNLSILGDAERALESDEEVSPDLDGVPRFR